MCEDNSKCTAYQYNGKSPDGGCWIHTSPAVGGGTGNTGGVCYIKKRAGSTCSQLCQEWMDSSPSADKGCKGVWPFVVYVLTGIHIVIGNLLLLHKVTHFRDGMCCHV